MAIVPPLLEVMSVARLARLLARAAQFRPTRAPHDAISAQWVDRQLHRLPRPWTFTCLRRAAVLYYLLRGAGREIELCIGVRRGEQGELLAHAWLLRDGVLYLEPPETSPTVAQYNVIAQFPPPPEQSS